MKYIYSTIIVLLLLPSFAIAASVKEASEALKNEDYEKAILLYQAFLDEGKTSGELHYNMGVAHAELSQIGHAIWHFRLAERLGLSTDDLYHNLRLVKEDRLDEIEIIPAFFLYKWWNGWKGLLGSNIWSLLALLFLFGGVCGLYIWRTAEERSKRKFGFTIGVPLVLIAALCLLSAWDMSRDYINPTSGVLLAKSIELRAAPDYDSAEIMQIHEGVDVDVQDEIGEWVKVGLANGQIGWLPRKEVGLF